MMMVVVVVVVMMMMMMMMMMRTLETSVHFLSDCMALHLTKQYSL